MNPDELQEEEIEVQSEDTNKFKKISVCSKEYDLPTEVLEQYVELTFEGRNIAVLQDFRKRTGCNLEVGKHLRYVLIKYAVNNGLASKYVDYPDVCCYNCIGACGRKKQFEQDYNMLYDFGKSIALGGSCDQFKTREDLLKYEKGEVRTSRNDHTNIFSKEGRLFQGQYDGHHNYTNFRDEIRELMTDDEATNERFVSEIIKRLDEGASITHIGESASSLLYNDIPIEKEDKVYKDYITRAKRVIAQARAERVDKINALSYEETIAYLKQYISQLGMADILVDQFDNDVEALCQEYFPDRLPEDIAIQIAEREE